jgi:hypothetical protein
MLKKNSKNEKINLHPKKPLCADKPDGWADFKM